MQIDENQLDYDHFEMMLENNIFHFTLRANDEQCCGIYIWTVGDHVNMNIGRDGERFWEYNRVKTKKEIEHFKAALFNFFTKAVKEKIIEYNDKPRKYSYSFKGASNNSYIELYNISVGFAFPWQKKKLIEKIYSPWNK